MKLKPNSTSFSLSKKSCPSGSERMTPLSSKQVLGKVSAGERRAQQFKLENLKK